MRRKYTQINGQGGDSHGNDLSGICGGGSENGDGDGGWSGGEAAAAVAV